MAAAYASLVSLMRAIEQIQSYTRLPISLDVKQMDTLRQKVAFFISFLQTYNSHKQIKSMENRIRDAADAAEDIIETHVVTQITALSNGQTHTTQISPCPVVENIMKDMDSIRTELMEIKDTMKPRNRIVDHSPRHVPFGKNTVVGFEDELTCLLERLNGDERRREIIPIVGMGGIGKTTLAKTAYERPITVHRFDIRAWVTISREYSRRQILLDVLFSMKQAKDERMVGMSDNELGQILYQSLVGMRYLVVMDDMWSTEAWWTVKPFFPDNDLCSRIVVTTRISSVSTHFDSSGVSVNFLSEDEGWDLFSQTVFGKQACPLELEEVGKKIVRNCKGLPLSIVVVGGLLAKSGTEKEYWEYVARDTSSIINSEDDERCMKILSLSYQNLPIHLKPCFLYVGTFPDGKEICVLDVINLWVAEGFIKPSSSKDFEVVGKDYLDDLISRNLVLVHKRGSNGIIKYCNIHDLLRDLCLREAHKEKFMCVWSMNNFPQEINSQRRTSVHQSASKGERTPPILSTLTLGPLASTLVSDLNEAFSLQTSRLLRVLRVADRYQDFDDKRKNKYLPENIFQLVNLRYVAFNPLLKLRSSSPFPLHKLWNLQILIVRDTYSCHTAQLEIWELTELRHLEFDLVHLSNPSCQQLDRRDDATLKKLQILMGIENFRFTDEAIKRIPNIKKLKISWKNVIGAFEDFCLKNLCLLKKLESLACYFPPEKRPTRTEVLSHLALPSSLKKLTLFNTKLQWEDMTMIGSLPLLEVLRLKYGSFKGPEWMPVEGEFRHLKFLKIDRCSDLVHWVADDTHFPRLEHLVLQLLHNLVEIPSGIGETLQSIKLVMCSDSLVKSAKEMQEEQEDLGNDGLQVIVVRF